MESTSEFLESYLYPAAGVGGNIFPLRRRAVFFRSAPSLFSNSFAAS